MYIFMRRLVKNWQGMRKNYVKLLFKGKIMIYILI